MAAKPQRCSALTALAALLLLLGVSRVAAQTGGDFDLTWNTIAGGGDTAVSGGAYEIGGTVGQPATAALSADEFLLTGGFWAGVLLGSAACVGDCSDDHMVTVDELIVMVNIALGNAPVSDCPAGDSNHDGQITVDEILTAVNNALNGCP